VANANTERKVSDNSVMDRRSVLQL